MGGCENSGGEGGGEVGKGGVGVGALIDTFFPLLVSPGPEGFGGGGREGDVFLFFC